MANAKVNGPIRPISISSDRATFPAIDKNGVTPKLNPTVPETLITSKNKDQPKLKSLLPDDKK